MSTVLDRALLLYTMTSGLGDYIVMGDLMHKVETLVPKAKCLMAHRGNPHVNLWPYDNPSERFFDVYKPHQLLRLVTRLRKARKEGYTIFGLQMAPGSVQGFFFHSCLKRLKALDFIVDFNLINADIITPPRGDYILDLHLNQVGDLLKLQIPDEFYKLSLPVRYDRSPQSGKATGKFLIGIHPWSRRGHLPCFVWPFDKWLDVVRFLLAESRNKIVIFGRDKKFDDLRNFLERNLESSKNVEFRFCNHVWEVIETVRQLDLLISVNTSVVHIGYALDKRMIVLCGPSLNLWTPKGGNIFVVRDRRALFEGADKCGREEWFPLVERIDVEDVVHVFKNNF
jgi:hypothetical protein